MRPLFQASLLALTLSLNTFAEEGGSGHYLPGSMASFVDGVPQEETFIARLNYLYYDGEIAANRQIPIAGLSTLGAEATSTALGVTLLWRPPVEIGENWSWAMSATIPYVWMNVEADVVAPLPGGGTTTVRRGKDLSGIGDIVLMPLMFNYEVCDDLNINFRLGAYAPTGRYQVGRLANTGKNFWTIEPTVAWMYFGKKNGREASLFLGADFNFENSDTNYRTGTQVHLDGTLAQHFPLWGGLFGVGLNAYWYEQVEGDSGAGATFGDFKGRTAGLGPALSYVSSDGNTLGELKWLHEFETKNRLEGDYIWFKLIHKF
ncbi:SphA family protein [Haloferula sp.]|uniref:SphA family protein n=1 Tax=Haloferula sp. TaxID=2497595 RepID=UPI00329BED5E